MRASTETIVLPDGKTSVSIPIHTSGNHVILPLSVKGSKPMRVVLDTGMPSPGLMLYETAEVKALELDYNPAFQAQVRGAGGSGKGLTAKVAQSESLSLNDVTIDGATVIVVPAFEEMATHHDGIIGWSLFQRFAVELDFDRNQLTLHEPTSYKPPLTATAIPFHHRANVPHITVKLPDADGQLFEAEVVVDLGASHALSLNTDSAKEIALPSPHIETPVGRGLSGLLEGAVGRLPTVKIAGFTLTDVLVMYPVSEHQNPRGMDDLNGNLGAGLLNRFKTTFDYANERILLEPGAAFDAPFPFDSVGIGLNYGTTLGVERVVPNSPASEAGIQQGDIITHVNSQAVTGADRAKVRETLERLEPLALTLQRGDQKLELTLTPRRLL